MGELKINAQQTVNGPKMGRGVSGGWAGRGVLEKECLAGGKAGADVLVRDSLQTCAGKRAQWGGRGWVRLGLGVAEGLAVT